MKFIAILWSLFFSRLVFSQITSNFTLTSDYVWRGVSQTNNGPAVQGGMDYDHSSGVSVGTWLSNVFALGTEANFYANYSLQLKKNMILSIGGSLYHYTKNSNPPPNPDTSEINIGLSLWNFDLSANYTGDYFGTDTSSWYFSAATIYELKKDLTISLSLGQVMFDEESKAGNKDYVDYKISFDKTSGEYTASLFYTDTNRKSLVGTTETEQDDHVYGFLVSRSL